MKTFKELDEAYSKMPDKHRFNLSFETHRYADDLQISYFVKLKSRQLNIIGSGYTEEDSVEDFLESVYYEYIEEVEETFTPKVAVIELCNAFSIDMTEK